MQIMLFMHIYQLINHIPRVLYHLACFALIDFVIKALQIQEKHITAVYFSNNKLVSLSFSLSLLISTTS